MKPDDLPPTQKTLVLAENTVAVWVRLPSPVHTERLTQYDTGRELASFSVPAATPFARIKNRWPYSVVGRGLRYWNGPGAATEKDLEQFRVHIEYDVEDVLLDEVRKALVDSDAKGI